MKYTEINNIRDYIRKKNITLIEDRVFNLKAKETPSDNYIILSNLPRILGAIQNMDLLQVEIYGMNGGPDIVGEISDEILYIMQNDGIDFNGFKTFSVICTGQTPTLTIENKFKITMVFQIRYLI